MLITSRSNEKVKLARSLREAKFRRETGLHFLEGDKLVKEALCSGIGVELLFAREGMQETEGSDTLFVTDAVMEALCPSGTPQNLCAIARTPALTPPERYEGFTLLLEGLQDPGNAGTLIRTADAFGAGAVLFSPDSADPYSPKALRASMGSVYHLPVYVGDIVTELKKLREQGFQCLCGHLKGEETLPPAAGKRALLIGSEGRGVTEEAAALCTLYRLPMKGRAESLNAAVFGAVMLYELTKE